jgi:hypothetical protein
MLLFKKNPHCFIEIIEHLNDTSLTLVNSLRSTYESETIHVYKSCFLVCEEIVESHNSWKLTSHVFYHQ